ncbi:class I SAM-dependent methyltransferase [Thioalkalivibrio paradoxus]|uniref:2-polyprenyl-3-methyl-5-hydroxy-6-metoxy-1, 4-benzoquinol methylase n=1 Tax=Thioalkalivibrio paradoxus ARh 1 TaxID=713585 RepID=W0DKP2_9GAMM|nr:class I SAM-dependent methyltransferase [Thioalkalivibrio paradoxus]AHE97797.1 2-polyprenyl-3-methyl-5-hydroxy-6-metoxy-1,4-benzoquinol methylase [Thioalkalivibrio paradoxus ARh 1]
MKSGPLPVLSDLELIAERLPVAGARLLELGCGRAETTRRIAEQLPVAEIIATEVDRAQHEKNLRISDLPRASFRLGGIEAIAEADDSVDAVIMLKSLHHVPQPRLRQGLAEIHRVLRPGGIAYFSEPVYAGEFNDILKLFHDERDVRIAAFEALQTAVDEGLFILEDEIFFDSISRFQGFEEFEDRVLGATHTEFAIDEVLYATIRDRFMQHAGEDGVAEFRNPNRADLLRKP